MPAILYDVPSGIPPLMVTTFTPGYSRFYWWGGNTLIVTEFHTTWVRDDRITLVSREPRPMHVSSVHFPPSRVLGFPLTMSLLPCMTLWFQALGAPSGLRGSDVGGISAPGCTWGLGKEFARARCARHDQPAI